MRTDLPFDGGRRSRYLAAAAIAVVTVVGAVLFGMGAHGSSGPPLPNAVAQAGATTGATTTPASPSPPPPPPPSDAVNTQGTKAADSKPINFGPVLPDSEPVALDIPAIDVHSTAIVQLGLAADGTIEVPEDPSSPGWLTPGPSPGQLGPAIIAGHVDSKQGPAVFYRLGSLHPGEQISVTRADGSVADFLIDRVAVYDKAAFPTHMVYGNTTDRAELRLITCGGIYDDTRGYLSNVVVFAHLVLRH